MKHFFTKNCLTALIIFWSHSLVFSQTTHPVLSQLFGGGGVTSTMPNNDFIELYNPTGSNIDLSGWSVQLGFGAGTVYTVIPLSGTILAGKYYLIQLNRDNYATGTTMPTPDVTNSFNINAADLKVGLVNNTIPLSTANPASSCVDFMGSGSSAGFEGTGPGPQGSYSVSLSRKSSSSSTAATMAPSGAEYSNGSGWDTDNNAADLFLQTNVTARSSSSVIVLPVKFVSFNVETKGGDASLNWQVNEEKGTLRYEIEKSAAGISFSRVGQVAATSAGQYQYTDVNETSSCYYRIKTISTDGKFQYSKVIQYRAGSASAFGISARLAENKLVIQHPSGGPKDQIFIYSMGGRVEQKALPAVGQQQTIISLPFLKPGVYLLHYQSEKKEGSVLQFVKM